MRFMVKNKKILMLILLVPMLLLASCGSNHDMKKFPVGKDGYPKENIVLINGKTYTLDDYDKVLSGNSGESEISLESDSEQLEILLPVIGALTEWSASESNDGFVLEKYELYETDMKGIEMKEGSSAAIQKFVFRVPSNEEATIELKHIHFGEKEKAFSDRAYDYLLRITLK